MSYAFSLLPLTEIAEVLFELGAEIEELGASLCRDPAFAQAHIAELQAIDHIAQKQREVASLLKAECPATAINNIRLEDLKSQIDSNNSCRKNNN